MRNSFVLHEPSKYDVKYNHTDMYVLSATGKYTLWIGENQKPPKW